MIGTCISPNPKSLAHFGYAPYDSWYLMGLVKNQKTQKSMEDYKGGQETQEHNQKENGVQNNVDIFGSQVSTQQPVFCFLS